MYSTVKAQASHLTSRGTCSPSQSTAGALAGPAALRGDESPDLGDRPGVEDMLRFHPAAPGRADTERHLPLKRAGAVAVAVNREGDTGRDGATRMVPVEVEVGRRAVHFQRGAGLDRGSIDRVEIERISRSPADEPVGRDG